NPIGALVLVEVRFNEAPVKDQPGKVHIAMTGFVFTANIEGHLEVDPVTAKLTFVPDNKGQPDTFPWVFVPPDQAVDKISLKLKNWLKTQSPALRLDKAEIEGNTLFLRLKTCTGPTDPACS